MSNPLAEQIRKLLAKGSYQMPNDKLPYETQAATIAAHLTAASIGDTRAAQAQALEDAAKELSQLPYARPDAPERPEYERLLAIRRGDTDKWLQARAAAIRAGHE